MIARLERFSFLPALAERAVPVVLPATICCFAMGSSSVVEAVRIGGPLRWVMLFALVVCAVPYGASALGELPRSFVATIGVLVGVTLLSALWSVTPRLSGERAISFLVLMVAVVCIGAGASRSRPRVERVFAGLLIAAVLVAVAGLVVLLVDHQLAVQPRASTMPARMRGFGQNPNTASMLFAVALPIAEWFALSARNVWIQLAAGGSCVLLYGSIMASGSRGAMLAAAAGTVSFLLLLALRDIRRLVLIEAAAVVFFVATFSLAGGRPSDVPAVAPTITSSPVVVPAGGSLAPTTGGQTQPGLHGAAPSTVLPTSRFDVGIKQGIPKTHVPVPFVPRSGEIGAPFIYEYKPITAYGSGRVFAWIWAIRQGLEVPLLGYGFGTETDVFVDRFYLFEGSYTENSFVGMFLQLGLAGVLLLLLPFLFVAWAALRVARRSTSSDGSVVAAAAGVVAAGFAIAFFQSYLYSVGNVATLTFWAAATIAIAISQRATRAR